MDEEKKKQAESFSISLIVGKTFTIPFLFSYVLYQSFVLLMCGHLAFELPLASFIVNRISDMEMRLQSHYVQFYRIQIFLTICRNLEYLDISCLY